MLKSEILEIEEVHHEKIYENNFNYFSYDIMLFLFCKECNR